MKIENLKKIQNYSWHYNWIPFRFICFIRKKIEKKEIRNKLNT